MNETVDPSKAVEAASVLPPPPRKRRLSRLVWLALLGAGALLGWQAFENLAPSTVDSQKPAASKTPPPQTIRAAAVEKGDMPHVLNALGSVTPLATVTVKAQTSGKLLKIGFAEGQIVKAGDFLAQIDDRSFQTALAQAQGLLGKDTALLAQAQSDLARYQTLSKQDSISRQQVDAQVSLVAQYKAAITGDQAQIDAAKLNIDYARIVAPISGRLGLRQIDAGNYVQPSDANGIVVVTALEPISVVFSTPEDNLPGIAARLKSGATLPVEIYNRANVDRLASGTLTTFDNEIDASTGTIKLRATFANLDSALFPNQFVNVRLTVDTQSGVALAPNAAIQLGAQGGYAYVLKEDSTVTVRKIVTGAADASRTVIVSGLEPGERVVTDGVDRLREGAKVVVGADEAAPASAESAAAPGARRQRRNAAASGAPSATSSPSPTPAP